MNSQLSASSTTRLVLAGTGLIQGFVYYLAHEFWPEDPTAIALTVAAVFIVSIAAVVIHLSWTGLDVKRLATVATVVSVVFAVLAFWVWRQIPVSDVLYQWDDSRAPTLIAGTAMALYVLLPFLQIYQKTGRRIYPYTDLFQHSWNNFYILGIGALLTGAFWSIIYLWYELFKLIDITFFEDVFTHAAFVSMSLTTVFGYGVALGRERERITNTLRGITLAVFRTLLPLLALIALLFLVSLPFTGLQPLWDTGHASAVLLSLIGLTILFLNGVYQDGTGEPPYDRRVRFGVEAALLAMPVYAGITIYALALRIGQYGLTPPRFYGVLFAVVAALYSIGYAVAVLIRRGDWMDTVRRVNMGMTWFIVACVVAVHTPLLDPLSLSADNQFRRLAQGKVDAQEFDYGFLRFRLGHAGYARLTELEQLSDHPEARLIRERISVAREAESYRELLARPTVLLTADDIKLLDPEHALPAGLLQFMATDITRSQTSDCKEEGDCLIAPVMLDEDGGYEYLLILSGLTDYTILAYDWNPAGEWERIGEMVRVGPDRELPNRPALLDTLATAGMSPVAVPYRDLHIGNIRLRLRQ
ncbi:MAG: DUF4153 domain-containing protein [Gemmatimonadota bacterium]|nr:MAG: DUF4153 domain-containing protein [Gemmatimonadota bacterium]